MLGTGAGADMDTELIKTFLEVANTLHFDHAIDNLRQRAQSALTSK